MPPVQKRPQVSRQIISLIKSHILVVLILVFWQMCVSLEVIPDYLLPSPLQIVEAFIEDFPLLMEHAKYTLATAFIGTAIGLIISFVLSYYFVDPNHSHHCHSLVINYLARVWDYS